MDVLHHSPRDRAFVQDPYSVYAEVLRGDPVRFWHDYGMMAVFDHATVQTCLRGSRLHRTTR